MAVVVVGGNSRNIGKTTVVANLIASLPEFGWTAIKITQYGHSFCTANGEPCECQTAQHTLAITEELNPSSGKDTSRFLAAGAVRVLWVRTRSGQLAEAIPRLRQELAQAPNTIIESNRVLQFLRPDLYLAVLDSSTADFKDSARRYLDRADAILLKEAGKELTPRWQGISAKLFAGKPQFGITAPDFQNPMLVDFVRERINQSRNE